MMHAALIGALAGGAVGWLFILLGRRELRRLYRRRDANLPPVPWWMSPAAGTAAGVGTVAAGLGAAAAVSFAGVAAALGLIAAVDLRRRLVPDVAVVSVALQALVDAVAGGRLAEAAAAALLSGGVLAIAGLTGRGPSAIGPGDIKLAAAIGAWLGPIGPSAIIAGSSLGVVLWILQSLEGGFRLTWRIPFGTALAGGVAVVVGWRLVAFAG